MILNLPLFQWRPIGGGGCHGIMSSITYGGNFLDKMISVLVLQIVLLILNAIFSSAEISVISLNEAKVKQMAEEGDKRAEKAAMLLKKPARFLETIESAVTFASLLSGAFVAVYIGGFLKAGCMHLLAKWNISVSGQVMSVAAIVAAALLLTYINLLFGEILPKRIAMSRTEEDSFKMVGILFFFAKIFAPLAVLLSVSSSLLLRIIGINPEEEQEVVTEEEIRMMLAEGKEQGTIQNEESKLIQNVFEFNDTTAEQVSTRRRDLVCLNLEDNAEEWEKTIRECRFSHFPIIDSNQEDVVRILDTKDYFRSEDKSKEYVMKHAVDTPYFVPENMKANVLFANMKQTRIYFAVVLDEYGGMSGIVTLHDLVEALVGELEEEEMPAKPEDIERIAEGVWRIQGCAQLDEVSETLNVEFSEIFDTFSGFVWDAIGRVPAEGEKFSIEANGLKIDVENIKNHMVDYAIVRKIPRKKIEKEPEE